MLTVAEADVISDKLHRHYWVQSQSGNLWHELPDGTRLTVFRRKGNRRYSYCVNRPGRRAEFSLPLYDAEAEAKEAAIAASNSHTERFAQ